MPVDYRRVRAAYGKTWAKTGEIKIPPEVLHVIGQTIVRIVSTEAKNEFTKRGWSQDDPMGGPPVGESFKYEILGARTIVVKSTFYGMPELTSKEGIPERKMSWLTQQGQKRTLKKRIGPNTKFRSTKSSPLVVPLTTDSGEVIFRIAPLRTRDAWIHPGIARFTFMERAFKKARAKVDEIMTECFGNLMVGMIEDVWNHG